MVTAAPANACAGGVAPGVEGANGDAATRALAIRQRRAAEAAGTPNWRDTSLQTPASRCFQPSYFDMSMKE
jgi:hypothetical protein